MRKCIGILKKVFPQEDFGDKENNSPFPFVNIFLGESNRTSSLDYNAHTGGWLIIRKIYIQKQFEKKKLIFVYFVVTKKTRFKA